MFNNMLKISAVVGLVALAATMTGCGGGDMAKFKLGTVTTIDSSVMESQGLKKVLLSQDGKIAYVLNSKGSVFNVDMKNGVKSFADKANWKKVALKDDDKDGTTAGRAKLDEVEPNPATDRQIYLTSKGMILLTKLNTAAGAATIGVLAYFEGAAQKPTLAWTNQAAHVDGAGTPAAALDAAQPLSKALVVMHEGKEFVVVLDARYFATSVELDKGKKFTGVHKYAGAAFNAVLPAGVSMVATKDSTAAKPGKLLFVNSLGVSFITLDKLGTTQDTVAVTADASSDKWRMDTTYDAGGNRGRLFAGGLKVAPNVGLDNNSVIAAMVHNGKIYISLEKAAIAGGHTAATVQSTGGVAVYEIDTEKTTAPDREVWAGVRGADLYDFAGKLAAVYNGNLVEFKDDATPGMPLLSATDAKNNKFKPAKVMLAKEIANIMYDYQGSQSFNFTSVVAVGEDRLCYAPAIAAVGPAAAVPGNVFTIHYEDKEVEVKAAAKQE